MRLDPEQIGMFAAVLSRSPVGSRSLRLAMAGSLLNGLYFIEACKLAPSLRTSGYLVRVRIGPNEAFQDQQGRPAHDADIRHIERRPVPTGPVEIKKIGHGSVTEAVQGVAEGSSDDES